MGLPEEAGMEQNAPRSLIYSIRLYQALLTLYPSEFRRTYGDPMLQVFRDGSLRAHRLNGSSGLLSWWSRTMLDTVKTALEERTQRGVDMSKEKFIKLSGWALMLGGLAVMLGWLASMRPEYDTLNAISIPIDRYANLVSLPLIILGGLLVSLGVAGLYIRVTKNASSFARFSLGLAAISGLVSAVGGIGLAIYDSEPWWSIFFLGLVIQYLGLALFGIANLRQSNLSRWNRLPLFAGIWFPLFVILGIAIEQVTGQWSMPGIANTIVVLLTGIGLVGLGYLLQKEIQPAEPAAVAV
jgi:hypothetical protein